MKIDTVVWDQLYQITWDMSVPVETSDGYIRYEHQNATIIIKAEDKKAAISLFDEYASGKDWVGTIQNISDVLVLADSTLTDQPKNISRLSFIKHVEEIARKYIPKALDSVFRNSHMNEMMPRREDVIVNQLFVDAIMVDFINYVGNEMGVDYGMYTSDLI